MRLGIALLLLLGASVADEESALYFLSRGRVALEAGDLDRAAEFLEKAVKEKEAYPPTLVALAELEKKRGDREAAMRHLDACLAQRQRGDLSVAEREAVAAAEKLLGEIDEAGAQFRKLLAGHVADLVRLARATKDRELATECWRTVLLLEPENAEARDRVSGAAPDAAEGAPAASAMKATPLFNGKNLKGLTGGPDWTVERGILTGRVEGAAIMTRAEVTVAGDFALTCEMRVKEDLGGNPRFGILFGMKGQSDHFGLWMVPDSLCLQRRFEQDRASDLQRHGWTRISEKFSRSDWHVYRIVVEGKRIRCLVDDREVMEFNGPDRALDGPVGLWVQEQEAEIRKFVLEQAK
jgi:tetratricopeptide (TPR) repeat protein